MSDPLSSTSTPSPNLEMPGVPGQPSSVGDRKISTQSSPESAPQPRQLTIAQQVLKDKFGLDERFCARFDTENQKVQTFVKDLKDGKFDPNFIMKFIRWLSTDFGGPKYEAAIQQLRAEIAASKDQELFKDQEFQENLATAIKSCDGSELPQILPVVHDLLAEDPDVRRDFFIKELLIPCLREAHEEISKSEAEIDIKNFIGRYKNFSFINQFCLDKGMYCLSNEDAQAKYLQPPDEKIASLITDTIYHIITGSESERVSYLQLLEDARSLPTLRDGVQGCENFLKVFDGMNNDFTGLLQCFGREPNEQTANLKALVDGLRGIAAEAQREGINDQGGSEKIFLEKASGFFLEKPELMYAIQRNSNYSARLLMPFAHCPLKGDVRLDFFSSVALQAMKKAVEGNGIEPLTDEQVQLLCGGVNLAELLRKPEKNGDTIRMVLKFIQDRALAGVEPLISFEDIMPADISDATYQQLVEFVEQEAEQELYSEPLINFIRNGRPTQGTPPNP
ncbi:MAG: hypothetical protein LBF49_02425 [Puniceicoccales bacterium]|jgi:hypothetical protein|nr:hypothetical protein [Puniceicoccales bacterium]